MYPIKTPVPYNPQNLAATANVFTTAYLGNYVAGDYEEGSGSHPGVDIVPISPSSFVYAILDVKVLEASENPASGKFVILAHMGVPDMTGKSTNLFSSYLHLSELSVAKGQILKEGDIIGKTGTTGQSTGEHLHFQIDRDEALFHPYWPFTFKEAKDLGL